MLSPRSLAHAIGIRLHGPELRLHRLEGGERALVFEEPRREAPLGPLEQPAFNGPENAPAEYGTGLRRPRPRFVDDDNEVAFREGLLRAAREGYEAYVASPDRRPQLERLAELYTRPNRWSLRKEDDDRPLPADAWPVSPKMFHQPPNDTYEGGVRTVRVGSEDRPALHLHPILRQRILREGVNLFDPDLDAFDTTAFRVTGFEQGETIKKTPWASEHGFRSAVRDAVERIADERFGMHGQAIVNTIEKQPGVQREELQRMGLTGTKADEIIAPYRSPGARRLALLDYIDANRLRMTQRNSTLDPERPSGTYESTTRAHFGPRVWGPVKRYGERRWMFAKTSKGGEEQVQPANSHWGQGVWGSIRYSVRDHETEGRMLLAEEVQRDPQQRLNKANARAARGGTIAVKTLPLPEYKRVIAEQNIMREEVSHLAYLVRSTLNGLSRWLPEETYRGLDQDMLRAAINGLHDGDAAPIEATLRLLIDRMPSEEDRANATATGQRLLEQVEAAHLAHPDWYGPEGAYQNLYKTQLEPELPISDSRQVHFLVRDMFQLAARNNADVVAIPTGKLNDQIQYNTHASAAHFYEGQLRDTLQKEARQIIGPAARVERVALRFPGHRKPAEVYLVRGFSADKRKALLARGQYMFADRAAPSPIDQHLAELGVEGVRHAGDDPTFGPILEGFTPETWPKAVETLMALKTGEARGALHHPDIGPIDVPYGVETGRRGGSYGLAHMLMKLGRGVETEAMVRSLGSEIGKMVVVDRTGGHITLEGKNATVVLASTRFGQEGRAWAVTAFLDYRDPAAKKARADEAQRRIDLAAPRAKPDQATLDRLQAAIGDALDVLRPEKGEATYAARQSLLSQVQHVLRGGDIRTKAFERIRGALDTLLPEGADPLQTEAVARLKAAFDELANIRGGDGRSAEPPPGEPTAQSTARPGQDGSMAADGAGVNAELLDAQRQADALSRRVANQEPAPESLADFDTGYAPGTVAHVDALVRHVGFGALLDTGDLRILPDPSALNGPGAEMLPSTLAGAYHVDGRTYLFARNVDPDRLRGLLLHEVGTHKGLEEMLGEKGFAAALKDVDRLRKVPNTVTALHYKHLRDDAGYRGERLLHETLAHMAETGPARMSPDERSLWGRIVDGLKAFLAKFAPGLQRLTETDLRRLVATSLRRQRILAERKLSKTAQGIVHGDRLRQMTGTTRASAQVAKALAADALSEQPFFSMLEQVVNEAKQEVGDKGYWLGLLANTPGVTAEEREWTGIDDFLEGLDEKRIPKELVMSFLAARHLPLIDDFRGGYTTHPDVLRARRRQGMEGVDETPDPAVDVEPIPLAEWIADHEDRIREVEDQLRDEYDWPDYLERNEADLTVREMTNREADPERADAWDEVAALRERRDTLLAEKESLEGQLEAAPDELIAPGDLSARFHRLMSRLGLGMVFRSGLIRPREALSVIDEQITEAEDDLDRLWREHFDWMDAKDYDNWAFDPDGLSDTWMIADYNDEPANLDYNEYRDGRRGTRSLAEPFYSVVEAQTALDAYREQEQEQLRDDFYGEYNGERYDEALDLVLHDEGMTLDADGENVVPSESDNARSRRRHGADPALLGVAVPATRYNSWKLPRGEHYAEALIRLPELVPPLPKGANLRRMPNGTWGAVVNEQPITAATLDDLFKQARDLQGLNANHLPPHFDVNNILAHFRYTVRRDAEGRRVMFIEEIQSDLHQAARKVSGVDAEGRPVRRGYQQPLNFKPREAFSARADQKASGAAEINIVDDTGAVVHTEHRYDGPSWALLDAEQKRTALARHLDNALKFVAARNSAGQYAFGAYGRAAPPPAPFAKSYMKLAMKRVIRHAVENDIDRIMWTTGEQQNARYNLATHVSRIAWSPDDQTLYATPVNETQPRSWSGVTREDLAEHIGEDMARQLLDTQLVGDGNRQVHVLEGASLQISGQGMKGAYDTILPNVANEVLKKAKGRVEMLALPMSQVSDASKTIRVSANGVVESMGVERYMNYLRTLANYTVQQVIDGQKLEGNLAALPEPLQESARASVNATIAMFKARANHENVSARAAEQAYRVALADDGAMNVLAREAFEALAGSEAQAESKQMGFVINDKLRQQALRGFPYFAVASYDPRRAEQRLERVAPADLRKRWRADDYRYRQRGGLREINTAVGALASGAVGAVGATLASAVTANQAQSAQRQREARRLRTEAQGFGARHAAQMQRKSAREALERAITQTRPLELPETLSREEVAAYAERSTGVPADYLMRLVDQESGGMGEEARAPTSSATGLTQFIESTWRKMVAQVPGHMGLPTDNDDLLLDLRTDRRAAIYVGAIYTRHNAEWLQAQMRERGIDRPLTEGDVYLAHFLGRDAALQLIEAAQHGERNAVRLLPRAAKANRPVFYQAGRPRSAQEVIDLQSRRFLDDNGQPIPFVLGEPEGRVAREGAAHE